MRERRRQRGISAPIRRSGFCAEARRKSVAASLVCIFRTCPPFHASRLPGGRPRISVHSLLMCLIPWWRGTMQEFRQIQPIFAKIRLENIREFSRLQLNSLRGRARNQFARAGNLPDGRNRSTRPELSNCGKVILSARASPSASEQLIAMGVIYDQGRFIMAACY